MTDVAIAQTELTGRDAGEALGRQLRAQLGGVPDALIVFAAPRADHAALLEGLAETAGTRTIVGCSSAGEFTNEGSGVGLTNATAIRAPKMRFAASVGENLSADPADAARRLIAGFRGHSLPRFPYRASLVLVDALAGRTESLIDAMTVETGGTYRFFGGGAGDDARFERTRVFCGTNVYANAAVALEIASQQPVGIGARHGWTPASPPLRVTEANEARVVSLNAGPAVEAFEDHAERTTQRFDREEPMPFFLHNIVGVESEGGYKLRVPLGVAGDGAVPFAAEVPAGATTRIMATEGGSAADAAAAAARDAIAQLTREGATPKAAFFFDCVATRLRLGQAFGGELDAVSEALGGIPFAGFNSYGQIVRAEGQFSGFHNCTAVVCVLPE
jgi:hypothetical protein